MKNKIVALFAGVLLFTLPLSLAGCGKGKKVPGLDQVRINVLQGKLSIGFVATTLQWGGAITLPIPGLEDATISVTPDFYSKGTLFQFTVALASLIHQGKALPLSGLPDGRPIPDISSGQLPRWDTKIGELPLTLYLSDEAFGLYLPLNFSANGVTLPFMVSLEIKDERGNRLGKVYAIPNSVSRKGSGLLLLLPYLGADPHANEASTEMLRTRAM